MPDRIEIEKLLVELRGEAEAAEADATSAADALIREASGITRLADVDADRVRSLADDFAGAVQRLRQTRETARRLRALLS